MITTFFFQHTKRDFGRPSHFGLADPKLFSFTRKMFFVMHHQKILLMSVTSGPLELHDNVAHQVEMIPMSQIIHEEIHICKHEFDKNSQLS